jgi:hypothetical protein
MRHDILPPVGLTSTKQLPGRFVRRSGGKALGAWHDNAVRLNKDWQAQPELMRERDAKFFAGAAVHNRWPTLTQFTCCAVVRSRRCNRITIIETGHKHCIKHAGPAGAKQYRQNCYTLFLSGRYPSHKWFADEARRMRTRIRDRQRRKRDGWTLPGLTLRFAPVLETRFRMDVEFMLQRRPWGAVPDYHRDQLRWCWRKFALDRRKPAAWDAKARAIMLDLAARGPIEVDDLPHATGHEPHVLFVERQCTTFSWRSRMQDGEIERAMVAPAAVQKAIVARKRGQDARTKPSAQRVPNGTVGVDLDRLLQRHGRDLRKVLAETNEAKWPAMLEAYDAYVADPTAQRHRRWTAIWRDASRPAS